PAVRVAGPAMQAPGPAVQVADVPNSVRAVNAPGTAQRPAHAKPALDETATALRALVKPGGNEQKAQLPKFSAPQQELDEIQMRPVSDPRLLDTANAIRTSAPPSAELPRTAAQDSTVRALPAFVRPSRPDERAYVLDLSSTSGDSTLNELMPDQNKEVSDFVSAQQDIAGNPPAAPLSSALSPPLSHPAHGNSNLAAAAVQPLHMILDAQAPIAAVEHSANQQRPLQRYSDVGLATLIMDKSKLLRTIDGLVKPSRQPLYRARTSFRNAMIVACECVPPDHPLSAVPVDANAISKFMSKLGETVDTAEQNSSILAPMNQSSLAAI
ncbi:MAG TPA: hypothetical protein V6D17_03055, partial [Candidatus Obscuribacterales bacterium]